LTKKLIFGNNKNSIRESNYIHVLRSIEHICIWESTMRELGLRISKDYVEIKEIREIRF
jgi:hypothetical protein